MGLGDIGFYLGVVWNLVILENRIEIVICCCLILKLENFLKDEKCVLFDLIFVSVIINIC